MSIQNTTRQTTIALKVTVANNPFSRMRGLLNRFSLDDGEALIIIRCNSIHMFFMKFAIDVIFTNREGTVIGLCENIQPFQLSPIFWKASQAIECPVGTISASQTQVGDQISMV